MSFRQSFSAINNPTDPHAICFQRHNYNYFNLIPRTAKQHTRFVVCPHDSVGANAITYKRNVLHALHTCLANFDSSFLDNTAFSAELQPPLRLLVLNNKSASHSAVEDPSALETCPCQQLFPEHVDATIGHVRGIGGAIFKDKFTAASVDKGLNHRPNICNPRRLDAAAQSVWLQLAAIILRDRPDAKHSLAQVKRLFIQLCHRQACRALSRKVGQYRVRDVDRDEIKYLQRHLHLGVADKAEKTMAFTCVFWHHSRLFSRINSPESFEKLDSLPQLASKNLQLAVAQVCHLWLPIQHIPNDMACLTLSTKFHKDPVAERFLTPAHACAITPVAKLAGAALLFLLTDTFPSLCHQEEQRILLTHGVKVKLNWRCTSINEFILNIPTSATHIYGADAEKCYKKPPLTGPDSLTEALTWFVTQCFCFATNSVPRNGRLYLYYRCNAARGLRSKAFIQICGWFTQAQAPTGSFRMTSRYLLKLTDLILSNILIRVGQSAYRQLLGFPPSPWATTALLAFVTYGSSDTNTPMSNVQSY